MTGEWTVKGEKPNGETVHRPVDSRSEAEALKIQASDLGIQNAEIVPPNAGEKPEAKTDGGGEVVAETGDDPEGIDLSDPEEDTEPEPSEGYDLPDSGPSVDEDPLVWMPEEFTDQIDGTTAINRKGFEVLAHHYEIQCDTEMVVGPVETNFEVVIHKATATDAEGDQYSAYGEAHIDDVDKNELVRYSDTRAYKRAVSRATGVGMVAVEELQGSV